MKSHYPLVIIGAGPAGMAAAQAAARHGVELAVIDQQAGPGGQIYRNADDSPLADVELLGKDYLFGKPLLQSFRHAKLDYFASTPVWYLDKSRQLGVIHQGRHQTLHADRIIIATGAQERPMPFPGWELAGVMTAGAAQILMKTAALAPRQAPVLVGSGPLLLLLAVQLLRAGVGIQALVETRALSNRWSALRHLPRALAASDYLLKGFQLMRRLRRAGIPWFKQAGSIRASGDGRLQQVSFSAQGKGRHFDTELLLTHQGVIPALQIIDAADCALRWSEAQQCWQAQTDRWGESSQSGIFVAGDAAVIGGARAASLAGQLAALQAACQLGAIDQSRRDRLAKPVANARQRHLALRPFIDAYYRLSATNLLPSDDSLLCRCEDLSVAQLRTVIDLGCSGPNQAKAFIRCGMGPCQGRFCAGTVEQVFAQQQNKTRAEVGRYRSRPPLQPIMLGQLASTDGDPEDE